MTKQKSIIKDPLFAYLDEKFAEVATKDDISVLPKKDDFLNRMDELSKEIQEMRNEFASHKSDHEELDRYKVKVDHLYKTFELDQPPATAY